MGCDCPATDLIDLGWGMATCRRCGVSTRMQLNNVVNYPVPCPSRAPYSRRKRFMRLLGNSYGTRVSKLHQPIIDALYAAKPKTLAHIYDFIRTSTVRSHKRYDALAFFAIHVLDETVKPLTLAQLRWAEYTFREIQHKHGRLRGTFPAYSWVCERCLLALGRQDLCRFVHKLKCKKRREVYASLYGSLITAPCGVGEAVANPSRC